MTENYDRNPERHEDEPWYDEYIKKTNERLFGKLPKK